MERASYFRKLNEWRNFPGYRLEPRIDVCFGVYLSDILNKLANDCIGNDFTDEQIIPEFPIKGSESGLACHVDFAVIRPDKLVLVELKTDMNSIDADQFNRLGRIRNDGAAALLKWVVKHARKFRKDRMLSMKYGHLLARLSELEMLDLDDVKNVPFKDVKKWQGLLTPEVVVDRSQSIFAVAILPYAAECLRSERAKMALEENCNQVLEFREVADVMQSRDSRFSEHLREWAEQRAGTRPAW